MAKGQGGSRLWSHTATFVVLVVGVAVTAGLALGARSVHDSNERRLLRQRTRESGDVLSATIQSLQTPLASAAEVAEATDADSQRVGRLLRPLVGAGSLFASAAVWSSDPQHAPRPVLVYGGRPRIERASEARIRALLSRAKQSPQLTVVPASETAGPVLEYTIASSSPSRYLVYAELALPKPGTNIVQSDPAFNDLRFALYLEGPERKSTLLLASTPDLPLRGQRSATTIDFGGNKLRLVIASTGELGGRLLARLPWLLLAAGIALALGAGALTERLIRQRERARVLASENATLYAEQRTVAQTLQRSLLPETLPDTPGLVLAARYIAGADDVEIGGDWYDVVQLDEEHVLFVVGDVSGRGLTAGTIMASLRYAIRAYAAQGDPPASILGKLADLIDVGDSGHFATVLCGLIDVPGHEVTIANAAHPEPLLVHHDQARFVSTSVGVPIGVGPTPAYAAITLTVPPEATLVVFTDGLVERRGEVLDVGLERLREAAARRHDSVDALLVDLGERLTPDGPTDDIAILGVRWTT
jgi:serine phosphatase RsbU (regulator of sigma subunit)